MDDNFLSFTINIIVNVVMFLATMSKFYIEDRPNVAEVIDNFPFRATVSNNSYRFWADLHLDGHV